MSGKTIATFLIIIGLIFAVAEKAPQKVWHWVQDTTAQLSYTRGEQELPAPLRGLIDPNVNSTLTAQGVINATNEQRADNGGLAPLHINAKLTAAAQAKVDDMFKQQYFEHENPQGKGPADLDRVEGYEYIVVGENLALGNFKDDADLVQAWMNSPGHRANILNEKYQEIGVAVGKGEFEGKTVWLAVQEFGAPLSSCPSPSTSLKSQIDANRKSIASMQSDLQAQKAELDSNRDENREQYNQAVARYNALASQINNLSKQTQELVNDYNASVNAFNQCLEQNT